MKRENIAKYFRNKNVIVLGSAPSVTNTEAETIESFDIVVRLNNYRFFNESRRIDVFYSYFGSNIRKSNETILNDGVGLVMCKYPNADFTSHNAGKTEDGISGDFRTVYQGRKFPVPHYIPPLKDFQENFDLINRILTTGVSAVIDILRFKPKMLYMAGFDFFGSKKHNINEPWKPGDGGHDMVGERMLIYGIYNNDKRLYIDSHIKEVFDEIKFKCAE